MSGRSGRDADVYPPPFASSSTPVESPRSQGVQDYPSLADLDVLIAGELLTARTEVLEEYLQERVRTLAVIGTNNTYATEDTARVSVFEKGGAKHFRTIRSGRLKNHAWFRLPLIFPIYLICLFSILRTMFRLGRKFDLFIGIGCFPIVVGMCLKKMGVVSKLIHYSIDYFPLSDRLYFHNVIRRLIFAFDRLGVRKSDFAWSISEGIEKGRARIGGVPEGSYLSTLVPLGFSSRLVQRSPMNDIERRTIGYVGGPGLYHGLSLLVEALPLIAEKLPDVKVRLFGYGDWGPFKNEVVKAGMDRHFVFEGFIKRQEDLCRALSRCAIGVAPYSDLPDNPAYHCDPGKPKLYLVCGLPVVITSVPQFAQTISRHRAGHTIEYQAEDLAEAVIDLLGDENVLREFRKNAGELAYECTSEAIFDRAFLQTLPRIFCSKVPPPMDK
ncbi:MAG: glycosyltransferase [Acidobacteria bacterium]|nr:glycosyltransferase [Acidobacteriota bacterium]